MTDTPLVYIVILTWNGKNDIIECLRSLKKSTYTNVKTLVVDNASTDGTVEMLRSDFPEIELVLNKANLRVGGGYNAGLRKAYEKGAEYILLLNNDTIFKEDFLTKLVESAVSDPSIGMVGPKIYYYNDPKRIWSAGGKIEWWKGSVYHIGVREIDHGQHDTAAELDFITGCCVLVKRDVVEKVGVLDESYFIYGEDTDWCVRTRRAGFKILYNPQSVMWHKVSPTMGGNLSWRKNWNKLKSQLRMMRKFAKWYYWITIPFGLCYHVVASYLRLKKFESQKND